VLRFLARRAAQGVTLVFLVATISFALIHAAPGDPYSAMVHDPRATAQARAAWLARQGFDRPVPEQYARYLANIARGDLGYSVAFHRPVSDVIADAVPNTLLLMSVSLVASFLLGVALGVVQARRSGSVVDRAIGGATIAIASLPDFWLAIALMLVFSYRLSLFPTAGMIDVSSHDFLPFIERVKDRLVHLVLPVASLVLLAAASIARFQRAALLDVLPEDFLRTARAKGLGERGVVLRHALRNALSPVITLIGLAFPTLLGGAVFVETVYAWPGMGYIAVQAVAMRDYQLVMATAVIGSVLVVVGSLIADVLHAVADPRVHVA
jgi:peptide/nickel transport system permease protein